MTENPRAPSSANESADSPCELLPKRGYQADNALRHGHTLNRHYSPTYQSWQSMLARCRYNRHNSAAYAHVAVCYEWESFEAFLADMGERPKGMTLDRKDGTKGYSKDNCRWATPTQQARNRKNAKLDFDAAISIAIEMLDGAKAREVAAKFGCSESLPREILRGRTWKDALAAAKEIRRVE